MQFELRSNGLNLHSNASNPVLMVGILFECLESRSNGWNLDSNPVRMVQKRIAVVRIAFEWFKLAFECFELAFKCLESRHSSASNPVQMLGIANRMLRIPFKWLKLAFECFESRSNGWNLHSNAPNAVRIVRIAI